METTPVSLPPLLVSQVLKTRDSIIENCGVVGDELDAELLDIWLSSLEERLKAPRDALFQSCRYLLGRLLTFEELKSIAWRLAGNVDRLRSGIPVMPWQGRPTEEWVAIQLLECNERVSKIRGSVVHGVDCKLKILTGLASGTNASHWFSRSYCSFLSSKVGFTQSRGQRPFQSCGQFTNLRIAAKISGELSRFGNLQFVMFGCVSNLLTYNVKLLKGRYRATNRCPHNFQHNCHHCCVGYQECEHGTHPRTFVQRVCMICQNQLAVFDPADLTRCVSCAKQVERS